MNACYDAVIDTPVGRLGIRLEQEALSLIDFVLPTVPLQPPATPAATQVAAELHRYFEDPDQHFDLPVALRGTPFQRRVWRALQAIPRGETRTYGELAKELRSSPRAVGGACRANPVPIVVPCHRVVGAGGLGGYSGARGGAWLAIKARLLAHEGWKGQFAGQKLSAPLNRQDSVPNSGERRTNL
ncbi:MAG: methylated-DNA--[protein]-cysteine S-methyltransferase [Gammaproteobacteria bacterium]